NSKPEGANVLIEGNLAGTTPFSRKYPEGTYSYRVELPRYHTDAGKVTLQGGRKVLDVTFRPKFGNVSVSSTPESGMQIYVNDENTGKTTPATLTEIASGEQTIKLMSQWYQSQAKRVTIADNQTTNVTFAMEPAFSEITVNTTPTADIFIDGTRKGSGTITSRMLPGVYTIKAEKEKHKPDQKQITVTSNSNQTINLILQPMQGNLDVATNPFDANITLDGKSYGTTPNTIRNLLVGSYSLQLTKTGYGTITKTITITEGKTAEINETLPAGIAVTITSTPTGAELYVDGSRVGTTPYTATLGFGSHSIKLINGKKVVEESIAISQSGKTRFEYNVSELGNFTETTSNLNLEMVAVRGGTFQMGDTFGDGGSDEKPVHSVTVSDFYMGKYEVTQAQWRAIMGSNPSRFSGCDNCPVEQVSWNDVQEFIKKLNAKTGKKYRLPTEAEWEYAARGGVETHGRASHKYAGSNTLNDVAWYADNSNSKTHPVGGKKPNELGIYDMSGNVWEWCNDWYDNNYYGSSPSNNPQGASSDSFRVDRGGSWISSASSCRVADRGIYTPDDGYGNIGFRLCLVP
ncbi:MAG: SUMF1/EgtB/PvdO family nonheme iron enzyme, partial [Salinivirgaceae bacterium]|nr:SUMF1/EgtB/PvdO family nonheme iron enzyme [Salinivirgaceae bacterium]